MIWSVRSSLETRLLGLELTGVLESLLVAHLNDVLRPFRIGRWSWARLVFGNGWMPLTPQVQNHRGGALV